MSDESNFRNTFQYSEVKNLIQAQVVHMQALEPPKPMEMALPPRDWVDRAELLEEIGRHLNGDDRSPLVVTGPAGVGKSALAAKVAASALDSFPDGQLYIDLENEDMLSAARSALLRLGIAKDQISDTFGGLLAHFRSATRYKSMLVVVDGADDVTEGLHFEPASAVSALAVFGLRSTADRSVRHFELGDLEAGDAERLLVAMCAGSNETAGDAQWPHLVSQYGTRPSTIRRLAGLIRARQLGGESDADIIEDLLEYPTPDLLEATYRTLSSSAAWLYRLLGVLPSAEFEKSILKVFDTPGQSGTSAFNELVNAQLVTEIGPDRCLVEPSVSRDAARRAELEPLPVELVTATRTSLRWYVKRAQLADRAIMGKRLRRAPIPDDVEAPGFGDGAEAQAWFQANHTALYTWIRMAAVNRWNEEAWALGEAMWAFFNNVPYPEEAERCYQVAVESTKRPVDRARMLLFLGRVRLDLAKYAEAEAALEESRDLAAEAGDSELVGSAVELLGRSKHWQGRFTEAVGLYEEALRNARNGGRERAEAIQLMYLGRVHRDAGGQEFARGYLEQALAAFTKIEDGRHVLLVEADLAVLKATLGVPGAVAEADEAIDWLRRAGLARHEASAQERLAEMFDGEERRRRLEAALEVYERVGSVEARRIRRMLR